METHLPNKLTLMLSLHFSIFNFYWLNLWFATSLANTGRTERLEINFNVIVFNPLTTFSLCWNQLTHVSFCSFYANFSKDSFTLRWKLGDRCILSTLMYQFHVEKPCTGTYFAPTRCLIVWLTSHFFNQPVHHGSSHPPILPSVAPWHEHPPNKSIKRRITKWIIDHRKWSLNFWWLHWDDWSRVTERHPPRPPMFKASQLSSSWGRSNS